MKIPIKIIRHFGDVILVEYKSEKGLERCFVPADEVAGAYKGTGQASRSTLDKGTPYGVDLEVTMPPIIINASDLMYALRERGLWTVEDYRRNPRVIQGTIQWFSRMSVNLVQEAAENSVKGGELDESSI